MGKTPTEINFGEQRNTATIVIRFWSWFPSPEFARKSAWSAGEPAREPRFHRAVGSTTCPRTLDCLRGLGYDQVWYAACFEYMSKKGIDTYLTVWRAKQPDTFPRTIAPVSNQSGKGTNLCTNATPISKGRYAWKRTYRSG
jgi:hypothetical protein